VTGVIEKHLTNKLIERYREDADLQNIIDFTQQEVYTMFILETKLFNYHNIVYSFSVVDSVKTVTWTGQTMSISIALAPTQVWKNVLFHFHVVEILQT